jgi:hypothetical protein
MEPLVKANVGVILSGLAALSAVAVYTLADVNTGGQLRPEIVEAPLGTNDRPWRGSTAWDNAAPGRMEPNAEGRSAVENHEQIAAGARFTASAPRAHGADRASTQTSGRPQSAGKPASPDWVPPLLAGATDPAGGTASVAQRAAEDFSAASEKKAGEETAKIAALARQEARVEDRLQAARQRAAEQASADFARAEVVRLAAERQKALQEAANKAAAERARVAQIEADKQATAAAEKKAAEERAKIAAIGGMDRQAGDALEAARTSNSTPRKSSLRETVGSKSQAVRGTSLNPNVVSSAADLQAETDGLVAQPPAVPLAEAQPEIATKAASSHLAGNRFGIDTQLTGSLARAERRDKRARMARSMEPESNTGSKAVSALQGPKVGLARAQALSSAVNPDWRQIFKRRCPSILESSSDYDDGLVSICREWAEGM